MVPIPTNQGWSSDIQLPIGTPDGNANVPSPKSPKSPLVKSLTNSAERKRKLMGYFKKEIASSSPGLGPTANKREYGFWESTVKIMHNLVGLSDDEDFVPHRLTPTAYRPPLPVFYFGNIVVAIRTLAVEMVTIFIAVFLFATKLYSADEADGIFPSFQSAALFCYMLVVPLITWIMVVSLTFEYNARTYVFYRMLEEYTILDLKNINMLFCVPLWWLVLSNLGIIGWMLTHRVYSAASIVLFRTINVLTFFTKIISAERNTCTLNEILENEDKDTSEWPAIASELLTKCKCVSEEDVVIDLYCQHLILVDTHKTYRAERRALPRDDRAQLDKVHGLEFQFMRETLFDNWGSLGMEERLADHESVMPGVVETARSHWMQPDWYAPMEKEWKMKADLHLMVHNLFRPVASYRAKTPKTQSNCDYFYV